MRIECPSCNTVYDVPGEGLTGRVVRCARCSTDWQPVPTVLLPPEPEPEPPPAPSPAPAQERAFLGPAIPKDEVVPPPALPASAGWATRRDTPVLAAWVVSGLLLAGAIAGAVVGRSSVMQAWPPSERAYKVLGLVPPASP